MFRTMEEVKKARREGESFSQLLEKILQSESLLEESEDKPFLILREVGQTIHSSEVSLDMTTPFWINLPVVKQQKYTNDYQQWYAEQMGYKKPERTLFQNKTSFEMRLIPPGSFFMEEPNSTLKETIKMECPSPFWVGKFLVTQDQWKAVMDENPSSFQGATNLPVEMVRWEDCCVFLKKLGHSFELFQEFEWEYACRGGTTSSFSFGEDENKLQDYGWYVQNSQGMTHPVGQKEPNSFGLYDFHGNVWEWCENFFEYSLNPNKVKQQEHSSLDRVLRGGSWRYGATRCSSTFRSRGEPDYRANFIGFRLKKPISS